MQVTKVSASEFQQAFGMLSDKARHEPVVITKHGRDSLVVMSAEEFARLKRRDRQVGLTSELPRNGWKPPEPPRCRTNSPTSMLS